MLRPYRKGIVGAVMAVRTDSTGRVRNWGGPVACVPTKIATHRGLMRWRNIKDLQVASLQMERGAKRTCKSVRCA